MKKTTKKELIDKLSDLNGSEPTDRKQAQVWAEELSQEQFIEFANEFGVRLMPGDNQNEFYQF